LELRPFDALAALKRMRERMAAPVITGVELITLIEKRGLPQTAQFLKGQKTLI
jgi:hypothetical protein